MNSSAAQQLVPAHPVWRMPIHPERYDRSPLSQAERMALAVLVDGNARLNSPARRKPEAALVRLTRPLHDVYALRRTDSSVRPKATRVMFYPDASSRKGVLAMVGRGVVRRGGCDG
jgi:hypothetical protein